jgi:hypothetical protein
MVNVRGEVWSRMTGITRHGAGWLGPPLARRSALQIAEKQPVVRRTGFMPHCFVAGDRFDRWRSAADDTIPW